MRHLTLTMRHLTITTKVNLHRAALLILFFCLLLAPAAFAQEENPSDLPEMKRAPVPGGELEYEVRGGGEPVLFIHGGFIAASFLPVMDEPALAGYRLIRYHRRAYASSTGSGPDGPLKRDVADAVALLRHVGVERAHIVGHSGGGDIALRLALDAPDLVHSLVLLEPNDIGPLPSKTEFYNRVIAPATERYRAGDPEGAVDLFMQEMVAGPEWRTEIVHTIPGGPKQAVQDAATFFEDRDSGEGWVFDEEEANRISRRLPILYILGSETPSFLKECRDLFHTWIPHAEDHVVDGVGHLLQMEDPQAVAEAIADFLKRHPFQNQSYVLKRNEGEVLLEGGIIIKASPQQGSQGGEMVLQTMTPGFSTGRHIHLRADEFFYVVSGSGSAFLADNREVPIEAGDVIFVPKGHDHKLVNTASNQPLKLMFFLDKPGLAETFREMHQRFQVSGQPMTLDRLNEIAEQYGTVFKTLE